MICLKTIVTFDNKVEEKVFIDRKIQKKYNTIHQRFHSFIDFYKRMHPRQLIQYANKRRYRGCSGYIKNQITNANALKGNRKDSA